MMQLRPALLTCLATVLLPLTAHAQARQTITQIQTWQRTARSAYDAEMGRDDACPGGTFDEDVCLQKMVTGTRANFEQFYGALKILLSVDRTNADALDGAQALWAGYRDATCKAIGDFFSSGSILASATMRCEIEVTRSRLRDLNAIYSLPLRN